MIQQQTIVDVCDNTGAKTAKCIKVLGGSSPRGRFKRKVASLGDKIILAVRKALPNGDVKQSEIARAVIVRCKRSCRRVDGSYIAFDTNSAVIIDAEGNPKGTRIFGAVARELREKGFTKLLTLCNEVV